MTVIVREARLREAGAVVAAVPFEESVQAAKDELRTAIMRERTGMSAARRLAVARGLRDVFLELPQLRHARHVAVYVSDSGEPGTYLLRQALVSRGLDVVDPLIGNSNGLRRLASRDTPPTRPDRDAPANRTRRPRNRHANRRRLLVAFAPVVLAPVLLVPALAVDTCGRRLGRGSGRFDRILRLLDPATLVLAVVHDGELFDCAVESIPEEPHDVRVEAVLTPSRIRYLTNRYSF